MVEEEIRDILSTSKREDRYMIVKDINNVKDSNPSKWVVHEYFQKVFLQIIGIPWFVRLGFEFLMQTYFLMLNETTAS